MNGLAVGDPRDLLLVHHQEIAKWGDGWWRTHGTLIYLFQIGATMFNEIVFFYQRNAKISQNTTSNLAAPQSSQSTTPSPSSTIQSPYFSMSQAGSSSYSFGFDCVSTDFGTGLTLDKNDT
jgi:hypothetical protein